MSGNFDVCDSYNLVGSCLRGMMCGDFGVWGFQYIQLFIGRLGA